MIDYDIYRDIKQSQADGLSQRKTADKLQISRITVKRYWDMTDSEFEEHIPVSKQKMSKNPHVLKKKVSFS
jgi:response regulator of citrate/malate metabolism